MLIRYRMNANITLANFQSDLNAIITGTAATVNDLSAGCDKTATQFIGPYPAGIYSRVNQTTFTYSKAHNEYGGPPDNVTHYFRITFNATGIAGITLARSYVSGTDTLVNSQPLVDEFVPAGADGFFTGVISITGRSQAFLNVAKTAGDRLDVPYTKLNYTGDFPGRAPLPGTRLITSTQVNRVQTTDSRELLAYRETENLNIRMTTYDARFNATGIDIVITDKCFFISSPQSDSVSTSGGISTANAAPGTSGVDVGIFDIGKTGVSREFEDSMLMCSIALSSGLVKIPYYYRLDTRSYGALVDNPIVGNRPRKVFKGDGTTVVIENPTFLQQIANGDTVAAIYGLFIIPDAFILNNYTYSDAQTLRRFVKYNYAILTE
jgi:hypothetical protein